MSKPQILHKLREWSVRYLPAEIIGTITALTGAFVVHHLTHSLVAAAIAGSISETIGFYSYFAVRDGARYYAHHKAHPRPRRIALTAVHTVRDMLVEFGLAEAVDGLFLRPLFMYAGPHLLHTFAGGLLAGKLAADVVFFVLAAAGYELKKRWLTPRQEL
jgi:hypothetical protein